MAFYYTFNCGTTRAEVLRAMSQACITQELKYTNITGGGNASYYAGSVGADVYYFYTGATSATSPGMTTGTSAIDLVVSTNGLVTGTAFTSVYCGNWGAAGAMPAIPDSSGVVTYNATTPSISALYPNSRFYEHLFIMNSSVDASHLDYVRIHGVAYYVDGYWYYWVGSSTNAVNSITYTLNLTFSSATKSDLVSSLQSGGFALESTNQSILTLASATKQLASGSAQESTLQSVYTLVSSTASAIGTGISVDLSGIALEASVQSILDKASATLILASATNIAIGSGVNVDLTGVALESTGQAILALASSTNIKVDNISVSATVDLSGVALESTLQAVYGLASATSIKIDSIPTSSTVDLSSVISAISATESAILSNFSGLALESTLQTVYSLASATKILSSGSARESTLQAVYLLASGSAIIIPTLALQSAVANILSIVSGTNTNVQFVYDYHQGGMKIDINTGIITHYKSDNATELLKYQMLDNLYASTTDPGSSFGRNRV